MKQNFGKVSQCRKKLKGGPPLGFFNIHSVGKYQKIEGGLSGENFFQKVSEPKILLREYPFAP